MVGGKTSEKIRIIEKEMYLIRREESKIKIKKERQNNKEKEI